MTRFQFSSGFDFGSVSVSILNRLFRFCTDGFDSDSDSGSKVWWNRDLGWIEVDMSMVIMVDRRDLGILGWIDRSKKKKKKKKRKRRRSKKKRSRRRKI
ncbi:hypothetical protein LWI28_028356 [Acer negundo]|uniref:Uncharacterized protein n=1 Tax=Acer negundo TaxID=4023 RepID=A0AAD5IHY8_ACENE|nr:hypothetical protein LWI28_028356 [Acer negundo]